MRCPPLVRVRADASPTPLPRVAESRAPYRSSQAPTTPYEQSPRYYRGRIIDLLRALPPGESVSVRRLPKMLAAPGLTATDIAPLIDALVGHGLVVRGRGRIALPD